MKHLIAYAFSDLHINLWAKFNDDNRRTLNHFEVLRRLKKLGHKHGGVPILFCGDLIHKPESMDQEMVSLISEQLDDVFKGDSVPFYCISGNHDMKLVNSIDKPTYSWVKLLSSLYSPIIDLDFKHVNFGHGDILVHGVPYIDHNIGLNEYLKGLEHKERTILLLHTDYPGAEDTDGRKIDSVENLNLNILNKFALVLCGHIHKPQRLSKKVYMLGAPLQQRRTDKGCKLGYWEVYDDFSVKFIPWEDFPKFIDVETSEEVKDDGNYYTVLPKKSSIEPIKKNKFSKQLSKKSLAKRYLRTKGIKDKTKKELLTKILMKSDDNFS